MANYPYTYLAAFMTPGFRATVSALAIRDINKAPGPLRQRLDRAVRAAGVQAPGYRPGKIPLNQLARPLVAPVSRASQVKPFTSNEDIAYTVFSLWLGAQVELRAKVAAFLGGKGLPVLEELPEAGLPGELKTSEMEALAGELGASSETDSAAYDDTALMLVLLTGRAPVPDESAQEGEAEGEAEAPTEAAPAGLPGGETGDAAPSDDAPAVAGTETNPT